MIEKRKIPASLKTAWKRQRRPVFYIGLVILILVLPVLVGFSYYVLNTRSVGAHPRGFEKSKITKGTIVKIEDHRDYKLYTYTFSKPGLSGIITDSMPVKLNDNPGFNYKENDTVDIEYTREDSGINKVKTPRLTDLDKNQPSSINTIAMVIGSLIAGIVITLPYALFGWLLTVYARRPAWRKIKVHKEGILTQGKITQILNMMGKTVVSYEFIPEGGKILFKNQQTIINSIVIENKQTGDSITIIYLQKRPDKSAIFEITSDLQ